MPSLWSPLPPSRSGIADYAAALYLDEAAFPDLDIVVAEEAERAHPRAVAPDHPAANDRRALLQVGNNMHHGYILERAPRGGAIVEFHDLSLHHLHTELTLARGDFEAYREGLEEAEGEWGRRFAFQRREGYFAPQLEFHTRVNRRIADEAEAVIVHSAWAKLELELQGCAAPIYVVPHFARRPDQSAARAADREEARAVLGLPQDAFIILAAGFVTPSKRIDWTLQAFEINAKDDPDIRLIIAGACPDGPIRERIEGSPLRRQIDVTGYLDDAAFCDLTLAADLIPVMRFPSAGESSGVAARAMGFGRLVVAPELMAFSDLDDRFVEKVHLDRDPVAQLGAVIAKWRADLAGLRVKEAAIAAYAREHLAIEDLRLNVAEILRRHWNN